MGQATVPCKHCRTPTPMLGTRECDRCHELWTRVSWDPHLAQQALADALKEDGLTLLIVATRHPQDYVLTNEQDNTRWRGTPTGGWTMAGRVPHGVPTPLSDFIRNATPEHKAQVFRKVMDNVANQQQSVIDAAGVLGNAGGQR